MRPRFTVDLLQPGQIAETWQEWFLGAEGPRRVAVFGLAAVGVFALGLVGGIVPTYWRLSGDLKEINGLKTQLSAAEADARVLKSNLQSLSAEARRQVRWAELLSTFSQQTPPNLKLQRVEVIKLAPPPSQAQQQQQPPPGPEETLQIEALTPLRPGPPPLLEIAEFMAGVMRDPAVNQRFQLKSWEIKPGAIGTPEGPQLLQIRIILTERTQ